MGAMTPLVKARLAVALVVPLVAYVAGTLSHSGGGAPEQQGTVYLDDAEPVGSTTTGSPTDAPPGSSRPSPEPSPRPAPRPSPADSDDSDDSDDREARVVTPAPVGRDDDEGDDERDDARDDTDDGGDTDD